MKPVHFRLIDSVPIDEHRPIAEPRDEECQRLLVLYLTQVPAQGRYVAGIELQPAAGVVRGLLLVAQATDNLQALVRVGDRQRSDACPDSGVSLLDLHRLREAGQRVIDALERVK